MDQEEWMEKTVLGGWLLLGFDSLELFCISLSNALAEKRQFYASSFVISRSSVRAQLPAYPGLFPYR